MTTQHPQHYTPPTGWIILDSGSVVPKEIYGRTTMWNGAEAVHVECSQCGKKWTPKWHRTVFGTDERSRGMEQGNMLFVMNRDDADQILNHLRRHG